VRGLELSPEDRKLIKSLGLITAKKVLYVANVDEADIHGEGPLVKTVRERAAQEGGSVVPVCGNDKEQNNRFESRGCVFNHADRCFHAASPLHRTEDGRIRWPRQHPAPRRRGRAFAIHAAQRRSAD